MPQPVLRFAIPALWVAWLVYWGVSARDVKANRWREPLASQLKHRVPLIVAGLLFAVPGLVPSVLLRRFAPAGLFVPVLGAVLVAIGLGFSVWARRHLGRNWSADVVVKEDHVLIRTGPYRRIRHPIYTGVLLALLGTAVTIGQWRTLLAFGFAALSFAIKARQEEARMQEMFPEYDRYRRESAALIPYLY